MEAFSVDHIFISILFFVVAVIYSSVGHAGASGYTAVMALFNISPLLMRPTSLMLNLVVSVIGLYRFQKAGLIKAKKIFPFLITSMPLAYWSAQFNISKKYFYLILGLILFFAGLKFVLGQSMNASPTTVTRAPLVPSLICGGVIGFLSGITGTGGAIFFTPLILMMNWADSKSASGLSIVFVFANSAFALAGIASTSQFFDFKSSIVWILSVVIGAIVGTYLGVFRLSNKKIQRVLGVVLIIAAVKLLTLSFKF